MTPLLIRATWLFLPHLAIAGDQSPQSWNATKASSYLDARAKTWFEFQGADRGEGPSKVSCVSCHTLLPCILAQPALRKIEGKNEPSADEKKVREQLEKRVSAWSDLDKKPFALFYDFDDAKKKESRGTEAVLNALLLTLDDQNQHHKTATEVTKTAIEILWKTQITDGEKKGAWDWLNFGLEPWEADHGVFYGAALAAIAVGSAPGEDTAGKNDGNRHITLLRDYLKRNFESQNEHNRLYLLWASTKLGGLLDEAGRHQIIDRVLAKRRDDGGWSLASLGDFHRQDGTPEETASDGYATGLVLHVFQEAGIGKDDPRVKPGLDWLRANQQPSGAWVGYSLNKKRDPQSSNAAKANVGKFMWDAATAYSVLALSH